MLSYRWNNQINSIHFNRYFKIVERNLSYNNCYIIMLIGRYPK